MALTAERIDDLLTSFVLENDELLSRASQEDPQTYDAVMGGLSILSNQFGKGQVMMPATLDEEPVKEVSPAIPPPPEPTPAPPADEKVDEIKTEDGEVLTLKELKATIKSLKPLAEDDDEVKAELQRLEGLLAQMKKKKS